MAKTRPSALSLTPDEKKRLAVLLGSVSSHTLLKVLQDMEPENADARLIVEVLMERLTPDEITATGHEPVIPK